MIKRFITGTATASFQVEGAWDEDGKTPSIWDTYCDVKGAIADGTDGKTACDDYHLYKQDIALVKELGVDSYRFSIAWPRLFPQKGVLNQKGVAHYKAVLEELKANGIDACATLYHWELPQWAQDEGGWENRECVEWFAQFASACFESFGGDVSMWITMNEPWCASFLANMLGEHAPGFKTPQKGLVTAHHILLAHGMAMRLYRKTGLKAPIGITLNMGHNIPASDSYADLLAANSNDGFINRWFLEPLFMKQYPFDVASIYAARGCNFDYIKPGDFDIIAEKTDILGINYYSPSVLEFSGTNYFPNANVRFSGFEKTAMGWDVLVGGLRGVVEKAREYTDIPIIITENGSAYDDVVENGAVHDKERCKYMDDHFAMALKLHDEGLGVDGYFCWSLLDNFEWAFGYSKRFGIVYVDYNTQQRIKKDSYYLYRDLVKVAKQR